MRTAALVSVYPQREQLLVTFSPSLQPAVAKNEKRAILGHAPELVTINKAYGENTAKMWLMAQLHDLAEYEGIKGGLDTYRMEQLAEQIVVGYGYLKLTELQLFFWRIKGGQYGQLFYGTISPSRILEVLRSRFLPERNAVIEEEENRQYMEHLEEYKKTAITFEEYKNLKQHDTK